MIYVNILFLFDFNLIKNEFPFFLEKIIRFIFHALYPYDFLSSYCVTIKTQNVNKLVQIFLQTKNFLIEKMEIDIVIHVCISLGIENL